MAEIQKKVIKQSQRGVGSRLLHAKNDKEKIAAWNTDLNRILQIFNVCLLLYMFNYFSLFHLQTELAVTNHVVVSEIHRNMLKGLEVANNQHQSVSNLCTLFHCWVNNWLPLSGFRPGQRSQLNVDPATYICI